MQPYFFPYIGYYRLLYSSDVFVLFDDVQFPRRGYVHRNRLTNRQGKMDWLTISLGKSPININIKDIKVPEDTNVKLELTAKKFPILDNIHEKDEKLANILFSTDKFLVDYLENQIQFVSQKLGIKTDIRRSSAFQLPTELKGQDRIIEIVKVLGGTVYINPHGGRNLYENSSFQKQGISLRFLRPHLGSNISILERLRAETLEDLREELSLGAVLEAE